MIIDSFGTNDDDIELFPVASSALHPDEMTLGEPIVHILAERRAAPTSANPIGFNPHHAIGTATASHKQYRAERGQAATGTRIAVLVAMIVGCSKGASEMPTSTAGNDAPLAVAARAADAVWVGEILEVGPAPGLWSGRFAVYQEVTYRPTQVLADRGARLGGVSRVTVRHVIVGGTATADVTPRLRPELAQVGATALVLARWSGDHWEGVDEHHGLGPATAANVAAVTPAR